MLTEWMMLDRNVRQMYCPLITHTIKTTNQKPLTDHSKWTLNHFAINVWISSRNGSINIFLFFKWTRYRYCYFCFCLEHLRFKEKKLKNFESPRIWILIQTFRWRTVYICRILLHIRICVILAWWKKNSIFVVVGSKFGSSSIFIF